MKLLETIKTLLSKKNDTRRAIEVGDILNYGIGTRMDMYVQVINKTDSFCEVRHINTAFTPFKWDESGQEGTVLPQKDSFSGDDNIERRKILKSKDEVEYIRICKGFGGVAYPWNGKPGQKLND